MGLSRIVSEINGDFSRKSQIFPPPCTLHRSRDSPWSWVVVHDVKKLRVMWLPGRTKSLTISAAESIQSTDVHGGQTDRHRTTAKRRSNIGSETLMIKLPCRAKKLDPFYFLNNSAKPRSMLIIFGIQIAE